jgi:hypothetical protein
MKAHEKFIYDRDWNAIDFRARPELYQIGVGEQGVLSVQPYKSEILPHWRFATPELATISSEKIYAMFLEYKAKNDFVGMDMARKFLQMGFTRSRRYANHKGGKKYDGPVPADKKGQSGAHGREELPRQIEDPIKAESARIFLQKYLLAKDDADYIRMSAEHRGKYGKLQDEEIATRAQSPKSTAPARRKNTS